MVADVMDNDVTTSTRRAVLTRTGAALLALNLSACVGETVQRGFIADGKAIDGLKAGVDAQAVLQTLGSPSTVSTVGNKTWYYISQTTNRRLAFMEPTVVDQRVLTVYFDGKLKVERVANYGLQDGKVFDFISRTTPTSGQEQSILGNILRGSKFNPLGA